VRGLVNMVRKLDPTMRATRKRSSTKRARAKAAASN